MSSKEIWWGMPLSQGLQERIMEYLGRVDGFASTRSISMASESPESSVSASLSNLRHAGWVELASDQPGYYRSASPPPVEDRNRIHVRISRNRPSRKNIPGDKKGNFKVGDYFLGKCVFIYKGEPVFQEDDGDGSLYQIIRKDLH